VTHILTYISHTHILILSYSYSHTYIFQSIFLRSIHTRAHIPHYPIAHYTCMLCTYVWYAYIYALGSSGLSSLLSKSFSESDGLLTNGNGSKSPPSTPRSHHHRFIDPPSPPPSPQQSSFSTSFFSEHVKLVVCMCVYVCMYVCMCVCRLSK